MTKIIPDGKSCLIYKESWPIPKIFQLIAKKGRVPEKDMFTTFNMGIGMVLVIRPKDAAGVQKLLSSQGVASWKIGTIITDTKQKIIL